MLSREERKMREELLRFARMEREQHMKQAQKKRQESRANSVTGSPLVSRSPAGRVQQTAHPSVIPPLQLSVQQETKDQETFVTINENFKDGDVKDEEMVSEVKEDQTAEAVQEAPPDSVSETPTVEAKQEISDQPQDSDNEGSVASQSTMSTMSLPDASLPAVNKHSYFNKKKTWVHAYTPPVIEVAPPSELLGGESMVVKASDVVPAINVDIVEPAQELKAPLETPAVDTTESIFNSRVKRPAVDEDLAVTPTESAPTTTKISFQDYKKKRKLMLEQQQQQEESQPETE
jgi:hypothetical protein